MKILITGASGFVGLHLIPELLAHGHEIIALCQQPHTFEGSVHSLVCDINDAELLKDIMLEQMPDAVVHLAGISHVTDALQNQTQLSQVNIVGTHNVCAAMCAVSEKKKIILLFISSALCFENQDNPPDKRCDEQTPVYPQQSYAASKLTGEWLVRTFRSPSFKPYIVRPFNHVGPGQTPRFVCSALAQRLFLTPNNGTIQVGNLDAKRDFCDVRDMVRAYRLILEKQPEADLFVLGSGHTVSIREVLDTLIKISWKTIKVKVDASMLRANDSDSLFADSALAHNVLGWSCEIPLQKTLEDLYQWTVSSSPK